MGILGAQRGHHRPPAELAFTRMGKKQSGLSRLPSRTVTAIALPLVTRDQVAKTSDVH